MSFKGFVKETPTIRRHERDSTSRGLTVRELFDKHNEERGKWNSAAPNQGNSNSFADSEAKATAARYENVCYWKLLEGGGRPAILIGTLLTLKDQYPDLDTLRPWLDPNMLQEGDVPPVFSAQLADWEQFQRTWLWPSRGKANTAFGSNGRNAGVANINGKDNPRLGIPGATGVPWDHLPPVSDKTAYEQDSFTTWTEYLDYLYWHLNQRASELESAKNQYWLEWGSLSRSVYPAQPAVSKSAKAVDELRMAAQQLESIQRLSQRFVAAVESYHVHLRNRERAELRFEWASNQLALIQLSYSKQKAAEPDASVKRPDSVSQKQARRPKLSIQTSVKV